MLGGHPCGGWLVGKATSLRALLGCADKQKGHYSVQLVMKEKLAGTDTDLRVALSLEAGLPG